MNKREIERVERPSFGAADVFSGNADWVARREREQMWFRGRWAKERRLMGSGHWIESDVFASSHRLRANPSPLLALTPAAYLAMLSNRRF
jgi:hypothetical protein